MSARIQMTLPLNARGAVCVLALALSMISGRPALAQATARLCDPSPASEAQAGPACLLAHATLGRIKEDAVYWTLHTYPTLEAAQRDRGESGSVIKAYGKFWLFTVGPLSARPLNGEHVADIGPIAVTRDTPYDAEFLRSTFSPGMSAPVHVHSGPEAFYAIKGDTCLETPDGVQIGRGPGNRVMVRAGPPMLLMAVGSENRQGFALILHDPTLAPTTLVQTWKPKGLCRPE